MRKQYDPHISLRINPELDQRLRDVGKRLGYNRSEAVNRAILLFVESMEE